MDWRRSSKCDISACVGVSIGYRTVWVRDEERQTLVVDRADWRVLLADLRAGGLQR